MVNIEQFENLAYTRQRPLAVRLLIQLLREIDASSGLLPPATAAPRQSTTPPASADEHTTARLTAAITALAADPGFEVSAEEYQALMEHHGWLGALFAASSLRNADHVLRSLSVDGATSGDLGIPSRKLPIFCLFYFADSEIPLDIPGLWAMQPRLAASLFVSLLAAPFLGTPAGYHKQERLLKWLAARLAEIGDLYLLPAAMLYRACMRSSYADFSEKHAIKRAVNELIRAKLRERGLLDTKRKCELVPAGAKPAILVVIEWFHEGHSIYRTHSLAIAALRSRFRVIGMGYDEAVDAAGREVFDEFRSLSPAAGIWKNLAEARDIAAAVGAQILYMPSVGMSTLTLFLSNLRITPRTVIGLGHPATTHSPAVDFVAVEEDFVGDPSCFSETLMQLPSDGQPYRRVSQMPPLARGGQPPGAEVQVAVVATAMKINPMFLSACTRIAQNPGTSVHMHFFVGNASGLTAVVITRLLQQYLGSRATFHPRLPYAEYMRLLAGCDLFLNAFPFGNTNGIVDTVSAGLVGVCKTGAEVHEHIDEALFRRLRLPEWLVTRTDDEYVTAAYRLIDDPSERRRLAEQFAGPRAVEVLFNGRPDALATCLYALWQDDAR